MDLFQRRLRFSCLWSDCHPPSHVSRTAESCPGFAGCWCRRHSSMLHITLLRVPATVPKRRPTSQGALCELPQPREMGPNGSALDFRRPGALTPSDLLFVFQFMQLLSTLVSSPTGTSVPLKATTSLGGTLSLAYVLPIPFLVAFILLLAVALPVP